MTIFCEKLKISLSPQDHSIITGYQHAEKLQQRAKIKKRRGSWIEPANPTLLNLPDRMGGFIFHLAITCGFFFQFTRLASSFYFLIENGLYVILVYKILNFMAIFEENYLAKCILLKRFSRSFHSTTRRQYNQSSPNYFKIYATFIQSS
jgi:hypothetical protein